MKQITANQVVEPPENNHLNHSDSFFSAKIPRPQLVGIIHSFVKREFFPTKEQYLTEKEAKSDAQQVAKYLTKLNIKSKLYPADTSLAERLRHDKPNMVFNLVGSVRGQEYLASAIPALLELLEIPYTGTGILGESLSYNKFLVKKLLLQAGVPVPNFQLFTSYKDLLDSTLRFPLISKLNEIHGAVEITSDAVSETEKHLRDRIQFLIKTYDQPVLVEEFIVGKEVTAILLEGLNKKVYIAEKKFNKPQTKYIFATFEDQWLEGDIPAFTYQQYKDSILIEYVKKAFEMLKMADYAKFDIRVDSSGRYYFIDPNSNPAFGPKEVDCAMTSILELYGISFTAILRRLIINTLINSN